jgi:hypothetical protein
MLEIYDFSQVSPYKRLVSVRIKIILNRFRIHWVLGSYGRDSEWVPSSGMRCCVVWQIFSDVSEERTAYSGPKSKPSKQPTRVGSEDSSACCLGFFIWLRLRP